VKILAAEFVTGAVDASGLPRDGAPEIALAGRSNVGKSSLINALVGRRIARTSAAPGKTREANVYRVRPAGSPALYLIDLPGYGYARGGAASARAFDALTRGYFARACAGAPTAGVIHAVDARHPGLENDVAARRWLAASGLAAPIVLTKIDTLPRAARRKTVREHEAALNAPALAVSAATGEGLDELWKLIVKLCNSRPGPMPRS
jgi:GTP-binding protein